MQLSFLCRSTHTGMIGRSEHRPKRVTATPKQVQVDWRINQNMLKHHPMRHPINNRCVLNGAGARSSLTRQHTFVLIYSLCSLIRVNRMICFQTRSVNVWLLQHSEICVQSLFSRVILSRVLLWLCLSVSAVVNLTIFPINSEPTLLCQVSRVMHPEHLA